jgi:hypothetical protein
MHPVMITMLRAEQELDTIATANLSYLRTRLSRQWFELIESKQIKVGNYYSLLRNLDAMIWPHSIPNNSNNLYQQWAEKSKQAEVKSQNIVTNNCPDPDTIGLLLIRPELRHIRSKLIAFLESQGCDIVFTKNVLFNAAITFGIYSHDVVKYQKAMVTRLKSLVLNIQPSEVVVFRHKDTKSLLSKKFKGVAGFYQPNTLRGDIVYHEMKSMYRDEPKKFQAALDPTGIMELCMDNQILPKLNPAQEDKIYLHHGVHLPLKSEVTKDLGFLLTQEEMRRL